MKLQEHVITRMTFLCNTAHGAIMRESFPVIFFYLQ